MVLAVMSFTFLKIPCSRCSSIKGIPAGPRSGHQEGTAGDQPRRHSTASAPAHPGILPPRPSAPSSAHASRSGCASEASMCQEPPSLRHLIRPGRSGGAYATDKPPVYTVPWGGQGGPMSLQVALRDCGVFPVSWWGSEPTQQAAGARLLPDRAGGIPMAGDSSPRLGAQVSREEQGGEAEYHRF